MPVADVDDRRECRALPRNCRREQRQPARSRLELAEVRQLNLRARGGCRRRLGGRQRVRTALLYLRNSARVVDAHAFVRRRAAGRREALERRKDDRRRARTAARHRRADAVLRRVREWRVVHGAGPRRVAREPEVLRARDGRVRRRA